MAGRAAGVGFRPGSDGGPPPPVDWLYDGGAGVAVPLEVALPPRLRLESAAVGGAGEATVEEADVDDRLPSAGRCWLMASKASVLRIPFSRRDSSSYPTRQLSTFLSSCFVMPLTYILDEPQ
jgi:hypothetical protein